ncbi:MAG: N-acetyltransferase [Chitinophagaceae bacterium]|jgi:UDP-2-acetamido-3-amino-2,3-dideoxy-glucuronate N-acetyltransferase|nr:N-acetyltransferase [Chitinophagaceae bacterium]
MANNIHALADVQTKTIGTDTLVWQFAIILKGAVVGNNCNINCHTFIENDVVIGNHVTVKSGVYLWDGITVEDFVFIGPNVTFTNDKVPRSKQYPSSFDRTVLRQGASIGAGATILGGVEIGRYALVGAGSLVTRSVPDFALVYGSPATIRGWVDEKGNRLKEHGKFLTDGNGRFFQVINQQLIAQ